MDNWDIFHSDRLEVERNLTSAAVREGVARGEIGEDDLARPTSSSEPWTRLAEVPGLLDGGAAVSHESSLRALIDEGDEDDGPIEDMSQFVIDPDLDDGDPITPPPQPSPATRRPSAAPPPLQEDIRKATTEDVAPVADPEGYSRDFDLSLRDPASTVALPVDDEEYDPGKEDEDAADFTLSRGSAETVEELDLAAMVDVAFQLVLFFLVTASTIVFKTLEIPKPQPEAKAAVTQGSGKSLDDLAKDYILVEIDPDGGVKIDHENAPSDFNSLTNRLRDLRNSTGRTTMLLSSDPTTKHKHAVNAIDAANDIGLGIALAQPKAAAGK